VTVLAWRQTLALGAAVLLFPRRACCSPPVISRGPPAPGRRPAGWSRQPAPPIVNRLLPVDLGPRDTLVDGERHVTLDRLGPARTNGVLRGLPDIVVLQMANPDVTDDTLACWIGLDRCASSDLNGRR